MDNEQRNADLVADDMTAILNIVKYANHLIAAMKRYSASTRDSMVDWRDITEAAGGINDIISDLFADEYARLVDLGCPLHLPLKLPDVSNFCEGVSMTDVIDEAANRCESRECACIKSSSEIFFDSLRPPTRKQLDRILRPIFQNPRTHEDLGSEL